MWKLDRIEARNLCAFRELGYTLRQGVTTLVFGDNRDNESQRSNGSGKSALIECIAVGITGSPLRRINNEEIINDSADGCFVGLHFSNDTLGEVFVVERELFRKGASVVRCRIRRGGKAVETDEAVHPGVDAYNKYILEKLGITRDELFNNFILSKYKYQNFLSSSDTEKKEIINRFSNGNLVDRAIGIIASDKIPVAQGLKNAQLELAGIDGRIEMLVEQIRGEESSREQKARTLEDKIAGIERTIAEKRNLIRRNQQEVTALEEISANIDRTDELIQELENSESGLGECASRIDGLIAPIAGCKLTDWGSVAVQKKGEIDRAGNECAKWEAIIARTEAKIGSVTSVYISLDREFRVFEQEYGRKESGFRNELSELEQKLTEAGKQMDDLRRRKRTLSAAIEILGGKLAGTVACPSCGHEFLVSDRDFDAMAAQKELDVKKKDLEEISDMILDREIDTEKIEQCGTHLGNELRSLADARSEWTSKLSAAKRDVQAAEYELEGQKFNLQRVIDHVARCRHEIEDIRRKLFDEAFDIIDQAKRSNGRRAASLKEEIKAAGCSADTLNDTIGELRRGSAAELIGSLKESLKSYRKKSEEVLLRKTDIGKQLLKLEEQEQWFIQFKTYLANTKIEALGKVTNEFLQDIGSDIRISFSGYTVLKSGKVREKISISLIRDGVDCGSFGKFSAGELARIHLSTILAMQRLVNGNCDIGKGLDLLVLDEIMESVDSEGNACMFDTLNRMGITSLVVSHGHVAESYPHKLVIVKENGESRIY